MKKLLFVYERMMIGGTTTALLSLLNEIDYSKYAVDLLLFDMDGPLNDLIPLQVNVLPIAMKKPFIKGMSVARRKMIRTFVNGKLLTALQCYLKYKGTPKGNLRTILSRCGLPAQVSFSRTVSETYDAAIGFMEGWANHFVLSHKVKAKKRIVWFHPDFQTSHLLKEADGNALDRADGIVTVSEQCKIHFQNMFPKQARKVFAIPNICSARLIAQRAAVFVPEIQKAEINFCCICRCDIHVKRLDRIAYAMAKLKKEGFLDGVVWHLIGGGPDLEKLQQMIADKQLREHVCFYGSQNNPLPYLKMMDFMVLASRYEGKPVAVDEALALGVPCLVTAYAAATEQISECNGWIVDNNDESVYSGLKKVITERLYQSIRPVSYENMDASMIMKEFYKIVK